MIVAGHDDDGLQSAREIPEPRQRLAIAVHEVDQVRQQPLLLVGLRDRDFVRSTQSALRAAEEQIVGPNRRHSVALLARPCGISLPRVDDRPARSYVNAAAWPPAVPTDAHRDRRIGRRGRRDSSRASRRRRAGDRVAIGGAVELHRLADDAGSRGRGRVDQQIGVGERRAGVGEAEQATRASCRAASRSGCRPP